MEELQWGAIMVHDVHRAVLAGPLKHGLKQCRCCGTWSIIGHACRMCTGTRGRQVVGCCSSCMARHPGIVVQMMLQQGGAVRRPRCCARLPGCQAARLPGCSHLRVGLGQPALGVPVEHLSPAEGCTGTDAVTCQAWRKRAWACVGGHRVYATGTVLLNRPVAHAWHCMTLHSTAR